MRKLGSSTGSLSSSCETAGVKRAVTAPDDRITKRSNSFSQIETAASASASPNVPKPSDTAKLESFFALEHTRLPKDPLLIFHVTTGEELASQLSFNWLLEERIAGTCEVLEKMEGRVPVLASPCGAVVSSGIDAADNVRTAPGAVGSRPGSPRFNSSSTITPKPPPLQLPTEDKYALLFGDDEEGRLFDDPATLLFGESSMPPAPQVGGMRDLVHFEPLQEEDWGGLEPMSVSDVGPGVAVREGNATLVSAPCGFSIGAAQLTHSGKYVVASRRGDGAMVHVCHVSRDAMSFNDLVLPMPWLENGGQEDQLANAVAVDEQRSTFWINAGKYVAGYDVNDVSRGPLYRLHVDRRHAAPGAMSPMVVRKNLLCVGAGSWINVWDLEEVELASNSDMSSSVYESISCSEGESSPQMGDNQYYGSQRFATDLGKKFCRSCNTTVFERGVEKRECSECQTNVCATCIHTYKLTSLGETEARPICNSCIPSIRKRIGARTQGPRPSSERIERERASSLCNRRDIPPHKQQEVVKRGASYRSVALMTADYSESDRLLLTFEKRQCALTWSVGHEQELRWFVGHTGAITAVASCESQMNMVATGATDQTAKIWDTRVRAPIMSLVGHQGGITSLCLVNFDNSHSFCFSGGADEVIKVWDVRKQQPLYELSTGNNEVRHMSWNPLTSSLVCATRSNHAPDGWPARAVHPPGHFQRAFHCGSNAVLQYDFTSLL